MKHQLLSAGKKILLLLFAAVLILSCGSPYEDSKKKRAETAKSGTGDVVVAVVWPSSEKNPLLFPQGVELAVREVNEKGGILGRKLRAIYYQGTDRPGDRFDAEKIAGRPEIVAVLGHLHSDETLAAMVTYEHNGILLMIAGATNPILLEQGFEYVFRTIPNDRVFGEGLARYAYRAGYDRIAIIDNNTLYGSGLADIFYKKAVDLGLQILIHRAYLPWQEDFRPLISEIQKHKFDALLLAGVLPRAGVFIRQLRQMGVNTPVLTGDGLYSQDLIAVAGQAAEGTVVPAMLGPLPTTPAYVKFMEAFRAGYRQDPDQFAALGYDTTRLLAAAMTRCGSTVPLVVASTLRHTGNWEGILGNYSFDGLGELSGRRIFFKQVREGQFVDVIDVVYYEKEE